MTELEEYIKILPTPEGYELYYGFDDDDKSVTFFRTPDRKNEIEVIVKYNKRNPQ